MIDLMLLSRADLERLIHMDAIIAGQKEEEARVRAARDYYSGDHPVFLTERQKQFMGRSLTEGDFPFSHNLVRSVIDTLRERLSVTGFMVDGAGASGDSGAGPAARLAGLIWQWWGHNKMTAQQTRLYRRTLRDGASYIMVDYDEEAQRPRLRLHEKFDGKSGIVLHRDPEDENRVLYATRYWHQFDPLTPGATGIPRKTVYLHHEIRKYTQNTASTAGSSSALWYPVQDAGDPGWPIPWLDWQGRPLGCLVVEFQNPGGSEILHMAGLQNALNKAWLDLIASADMAGFPILAAEYADKDDGASVTQDQGDEDLAGADELRISPGRLFEIFGGRLHRIEGANLGELIDLMWTITKAISAVTRTPQQFLAPFPGVDVPSGEALKQLESGLVSKAEERQTTLSDSWADVFALAYRVARTFGPDGLPDLTDPLISPQWKDPNTRMEKVEAEIAKMLKELGLPDDVVWGKAGLSPDQISRYLDQAIARRAQELTILAGSLSGQAPTNPARTGPQVPALNLGQAA